MQQESSYLEWLIKATDTECWVDSADPQEWEKGVALGFTGATTNPVLVYQALSAAGSPLRAEMSRLQVPKEALSAAATAIVAERGAAVWAETHRASGGRLGYVCAQVNPALAASRSAMVSMAGEFHRRAANIAIKLPATAAGLDALEACVAKGITVTATVSFTVAQSIAIGESHRRGIEEARKKGREPGKCFAVIMIGRINDYLRTVAQDNGIPVSEAEISQAGVAISKRAYRIFQDRGYEAVLLLAGFREVAQVTALAGAQAVATFSSQIIASLRQDSLPQKARHAEEPEPPVLANLSKIPDFVRAYEPDGLEPADFIAFGEVQRTLTQFHEAGWRALEGLLSKL
jgi:transaldolase